MSNSEPFDNSEIYNDPAIMTTNNCYAFAMDSLNYNVVHQCDGKTNCEKRYPQPGATKKKAYLLHTAAGRTCKTVEKLIKEDIPDITDTTFTARCPVGSSKIAMVVHPGEDYHFYKQVRTRDPKTRKIISKWVHKDGGNPAKDYDAEGKPIVNPEFAARNYRPRSFLHYKDFCNFYCVPRNRQIHLDID